MNRASPRSGHTSAGVRAARYDVVQERFGIRFVLDEHECAGVSVVVTREPVDYWLGVLETYDPTRMSADHFSKVLEGVSPRGVAQEDGGLVSSWSCPSLLKALYLMLYLDELAGTKLQKYQAPSCPEYYRRGPRPSKVPTRTRAGAPAGHLRRSTANATRRRDHRCPDASYTNHHTNAARNLPITPRATI